jgi:hypothetical protein
MWNKVNLRSKNKNLPDVGQRVIWATNENSLSKNVFHQFYGQLTKDEKNIDYGYGWNKLTSNYWWQSKPEDPTIQ